MSISQVRQELITFCGNNPQPNDDSYDVWLENYTAIYVKFPWHYKVWAEFAGRYVQANSWYLRCGTNNILNKYKIKKDQPQT